MENKNWKKKKMPKNWKSHDYWKLIYSECPFFANQNLICATKNKCLLQIFLQILTYFINTAIVTKVWIS